MFEKKQKWWEKEAEEQGLSVGEYIKLLKLEKENFELKAKMLELKIKELKEGKANE